MVKVNISDKKLKSEFLLIRMNKRKKKIEDIYASDDIKSILRKFR